MRIDEIETREAEIRDIVNGTEPYDAEELLAEVRSLKDEKAALKEQAAAAAELRTVVGEETKSEIRKQEITKMEEIRTFAIDSVEYRDAYLKNLQGKPMSVEERAALTSAASVIPTETLNKIYGLLEENPLIKAVNALHVPGYVSVPKATTVNDAAWVAMATAATDSADVVGSVSLTAKKLIKTIEITADIQAMAVPAFQAWLTQKLARKMEKAICAAIINGAGSTTVPTGILKGRTANETGVSTIAKLSKLMGDLGGAYHAGAVWIMSSAVFYGTIVPLCSDKNGIFVMNGIDTMLLGHKVILEDTCDVTGTGAAQNIIFGNLDEGYVFNYGEGIAIEADQSVAFRSGSTVYRAMALCDGAVADADAFVLGTV